MGRGTYIGGHTVFGPGSDWFSYAAPPKRKPRKKGKRGPATTKRKKLSKGDKRFKDGEARRAAIAAAAPDRAAQRAKAKAASIEPGKTETASTFIVERRSLKPRQIAGAQATRGQRGHDGQS